MRPIILLLVLVSSSQAKQDFLDIIQNKTSTKCKKQLQEFVENLNTTSWAFQMMDSYSEIPRGLTRLKFEDVGDFQQCVNIQNEGSDKEIFGKYCLGYVRINNKSSLVVRDAIDLVRPVWSVCVPNGCNTEDVNIIGNKILTNLLEDQTISVNFTDLLCQSIKEVDPPLSTAAIITIICLVCLFCVVLASTFYNIYCIYYSSKTCPLIIEGFSLYSNSKKIFKLNKSNSNHLPCLDGLKFISMLWIIALHQFSFSMSGSLTNLNNLKHFPDSVSNMFILSGDISVDTFFTIGGTLVSYGFFNARHKKIKFNLIQFYLHRYLRLTASLWLVVLVSSTLIRHMGSGPNWPNFIVFFQTNCENNWWSTLLYVQNYLYPTNMCVGQTWYLNVDMQLYLISPVILFLLWKYEIVGLVLIVLCCLVSMISSFCQVWWYHLPAIGFGIYNSHSADYQKNYYLMTHTRATPWFVGVILGFYIIKIRQRKIRFKLHKLVVGLLWILCFGILLTCVLGGHDLFIDHDYNVVPNAVYAALVRPVWSLGISWVILACTINYSGPINWLLSLPIFQVFNRFTYNIYLTHVTTLGGLALGKKWPEYFSVFHNIYNFWGTLWINAGFAILLVFIAELPILTLEKIIIGFFNNKHKPQNCDSEHGVTNIAFDRY